MSYPQGTIFNCHGLPEVKARFSCPRIRLNSNYKGRNIMAFYIQLRVDEEKEAAIQSLFTAFGWDLDYERVPDQSGRNRKRQKKTCTARRDVPVTPTQNTPAPSPNPPDLVPLADDDILECPHCLLSPCITEGGRDADFIGCGQLACPQNRGIRHRSYCRYWNQLNFLGAWSDPRYLVKKTNIAEGEWALLHRREVMPLCVLKKVRGLYPNPAGIPYVGHMWG